MRYSRCHGDPGDSIRSHCRHWSRPRIDSRPRSGFGFRHDYATFRFCMAFMLADMLRPKGGAALTHESRVTLSLESGTSTPAARPRREAALVLFVADHRPVRIEAQPVAPAVRSVRNGPSQYRECSPFSGDSEACLALSFCGAFGDIAGTLYGKQFIVEPRSGIGQS
jgi:hypothetical protein